MRRTGFGPSDWLSYALVLGLIIASITAFALYLDHKSDDVAQKQEIFYDKNLAEQVLTAPCATTARGVFTMDALEQGSFSCVKPRSAFQILFKTVNHNCPDKFPAKACTGWKIKPGSVVNARIGSVSGEDYRVLVKDRSSGETIPILLWVDSG